MSAEQEIKHHAAAAVRARSPKKRAEHELAAQILREGAGIPEPVSFGRTESFHNNAAHQRTESARVRQYTQKDVQKK